MRREIVLDTETTGLDWAKGDRVIEIGCVELVNHIATGANFHVYIDPQRPVHPDAMRVHGITDEFLRGKPLFEAIADEFLAFIGDATLVIHNASFDIGFLNAEIGRLGHPPIEMSRVVDTLMIARRKHPGAANSLDALCARYGIDNSKRTHHGALLDSEILAEVYGELIGGRQAALGLAPAMVTTTTDANGVVTGLLRKRPMPLDQRLTAQELAAHADFVSKLGGETIWADYLGDPSRPVQ
ncbi:MAG: DNA polymerase III subunit epsilon [Beijerinckiaceae bacterium]